MGIVSDGASGALVSDSTRASAIGREEAPANGTSNEYEMETTPITEEKPVRTVYLFMFIFVLNDL